MNIITTSRNIHKITQIFAKDLAKIITGSVLFQRGNRSIEEIVAMAKRSSAKNLIIIHENKGKPSALNLTSLPFGPTYFFTLSDLKMRTTLIVEAKAQETPIKEIKTNKTPFVFFENFTKKVGLQTKDALLKLFGGIDKQYQGSECAVVFHCREDLIYFRVYEFRESYTANEELGRFLLKSKKVILAEIGPRFALKLYKVLEETPDVKYTKEKFKLFRVKKKKKAII